MHVKSNNKEVDQLCKNLFPGFQLKLSLTYITVFPANKNCFGLLTTYITVFIRQIKNVSVFQVPLYVYNSLLLTKCVKWHLGLPLSSARGSGHVNVC